MRIAYFANYLPYPEDSQESPHAAWGGASLVALRLALAMEKRGHQITIFTTSSDSHNAVEKYSGLSVYRYGTKFTIGSSRVSFDIFRDPLRYNVDIVHTHFSVPIADLAGLWYAKRKRLPMVLTYHLDLRAKYGKPINRIGALFHNTFFVHKILSYASVIICPSRYYIGESRFLKRYQDKIEVIPNGINMEEFALPYSKEECREKLQLPLGSDIILFISMLIERKRPDLLLQAMPRIIKECPNARLILVGDGVLKEELERLSKELGISNRVEFTGWIGDKSRKALYYNAADVFVFPSVEEVLPLVLLEAAASGLPIAVSDLPSLRHIVTDKENAVIFKRDDIGGLANAVICLLKNPGLGKILAEKGKKSVKDWSWENIALETETVYSNLLDLGIN